jgi:hypothetical protein
LICVICGLLSGGRGKSVDAGGVGEQRLSADVSVFQRSIHGARVEGRAFEHR